MRRLLYNNPVYLMYVVVKCTILICLFKTKQTLLSLWFKIDLGIPCGGQGDRMVIIELSVQK